jgi:plastocyanin
MGSTDSSLVTWSCGHARRVSTHTWTVLSRHCWALGAAVLIACTPTPAGTNVTPGPAKNTVTTTAPQALAIPTDAAGVPLAMVWMGEHYFAPSTLTIPVGTTVMWRMLGQQEHDVWSMDGGSSFHSPTMGPGATYTHTFTRVGTFKYTCIPHGGDGMYGEVIVRSR